MGEHQGGRRKRHRVPSRVLSADDMVTQGGDVHNLGSFAVHQLYPSMSLKVVRVKVPDPCTGSVGSLVFPDVHRWYDDLAQFLKWRSYRELKRRERGLVISFVCTDWVVVVETSREREKGFQGTCTYALGDVAKANLFPDVVTTTVMLVRAMARC